MSVRETVYDPSGAMFEVKPSLIPDLLLNKGWTRNKPEIVAVTEAEHEEASTQVDDSVDKISEETITPSRYSRKGNRGTKKETPDEGE